MTTPHKYAEILRAIADGIPVQAYHPLSPEKGWQDIDTNLSFSVFLSGGVEYRIKPKPLIKKWRWVYQKDDGYLGLTASYYADQSEWVGPGGLFVQKIESTMIEVEQDD